MNTPSTPIADVPGVARPAVRALAAQGVHLLGDLAGRDWPELARLHGVGPSAGRRLQAALAEHGATMQDPPAAQERRDVVTRGATGTGAGDPRTRATAVDPAEYVAGLEPRRRRDGGSLLEIFGTATGASPTMWGPSMIGYGEVHYRYATGREGDTFQLGFSPRRAELALYGLQGSPHLDELLERLGRHRRGVGCVWVRSLDDVDHDVLRELVRHAWTHGPDSTAP